MSLKAKIEAVIYASEEPVTLAQLVGLLGQEAQAELDRAESAQSSLALNEPGGDLAGDLNRGEPDILNETEEDLEAAAEADATLGPEPDLSPDISDNLSSADAEVEAAPDDAQGDAGDEVSSAEEAASGADEPPGGQADAVPVSEQGERTPEEPAEDGQVAEGGQVADGGQAAEDGQAAEEDGSSAVAEVDSLAAARAERARMARLRAYFRTVMDSLIAEYAREDRGLEIREIAGGFRFATKPEYHDAVRGFVRSLKPPLKLSLQALETLAVIAYKQPITAPEISEIRGVDSGGVLGSLITRKLIATAGRKQVIGRPILYKTTKDFLLKFGLKDINELPSIEEFERMAGQMAEQEEIPMPDTADPRPDVDPALEQSAEKVEPERHVHSPQADGDSAPADNLERAPEQKAGVDGRLSSVPPNYDAAETADDPSAQEAEIQSEQGS